MTTIRSRPVTKEYAEGWDRMFGPDSEREKRKREQEERIRECIEKPNPHLERLP